MSSPSEKESYDSRAQAIVEDVIARRRQGEVIADEQVLEQHPELLGTLEGLLRKAAFLELTRSSASHQAMPLENLLQKFDADPELIEPDQQAKETPVQDILVSRSPTPAPPPPPAEPTAASAAAEDPEPPTAPAPATPAPDPGAPPVYRGEAPPAPPVPVDDWESLDIPLDDGLLDYTSFNKPAEPAPVDAAPVDTAPADTAPVDTAPVDTAPAETAPAKAESAEVAQQANHEQQVDSAASAEQQARAPLAQASSAQASLATQAPQAETPQAADDNVEAKLAATEQATDEAHAGTQESELEPAVASAGEQAQAAAQSTEQADAELPRITIDEDSGNDVDAESHLDQPPPVDEPSTTIQKGADESFAERAGQTVVGIGPVRPAADLDDEPTARLDQSPGFGETARYRPTSRPPTAILRVFDDNQTSGELIRMRKADITIGREKGDVIVGHDHQMSSRHARIERAREDDVWRWVLRDLDSTNGVFVKARRIRLRDGDQLLIANRAVQFQQGGDGKPTCLQEIRSKGEGERLVLEGEDCWIGRDGSLCTSFLADEPTLDDRFARMLHRTDGRWTIWSTQTLNGLWVRVDHISLVGGSMFQLGEQRFSFHTP